VKTAIALTPENASTLSWWSKLTGLPTEELINFCLAEYLQKFNRDNDESFPEETLGLLKFKDRQVPNERLNGSRAESLRGTRANTRFLKAPSPNCQTAAFKLTHL
jgi:hypothetical protein